MPAVAAIGGFLSSGIGAMLLGGVSSAIKASAQASAIKKAEHAQSRFLAKERAATGKPEDFEPGIYEQFMEKETPRLEAEMAERGMSASTDFERRSTALGTEGERFSRQAALERWSAQANVAQRQVEQAYSTAQVPGAAPEEAFWGGVVGSSPVQNAISGVVNAPVFSGITPGTKPAATPGTTPDYFGADVFAAA